MAYTFTRTGAQIEEIHNTVEDPKSNTQFSDDIRTIAGEYRGLWPETGGSANKGDTYQTQVSSTGTGQYFTALQDTTVDPIGDDVNWREVVSSSELRRVEFADNLKLITDTTETPFGWDSVNDLQLYESQENSNSSFMHRGTIASHIKGTGLRRNNAAASFKNGDTETSEVYTPQVTGVNSSAALAAYDSVDRVGLFAEAASSPYLAAEDVSSSEVTYTENTCELPQASVDTLVVGSVLKTKHTQPYYGIVTGISGNTVTVDPWANASGVGTPPSGNGLFCNFINKCWAINANVILEPNSRADLAAICEFGLLNNSGFNSVMNGVDSILLPASAHAGNAGFLSRGNWNIGYVAQDSGTVGYKSETTRGFWANDALFGFVATGSGADKAFQVRSSLVGGDVKYSVNLNGQQEESAYRWDIASDGMQTSNTIGCYIYTGTGSISVTLPQSPFDGQIFRFKKPVNAGDVTFTAPSGYTIVGGAGAVSSYNLLGTFDLEAVLVGTEWILPVKNP